MDPNPRNPCETCGRNCACNCNWNVSITNYDMNTTGSDPAFERFLSSLDVPSENNRKGRRKAAALARRARKR